MKICPSLWLIGLLLLPAQAEFRKVEAQKKAVDVQTLLVPDRQNIVCFFTSSSSICCGLYPNLQEIGSRPKYEMIVVDVGSLQTPTAKKYALTSVPYFQIYDSTGQMISEGPTAYKKVTGMMKASP
jgi:hypothetical protein